MNVVTRLMLVGVGFGIPVFLWWQAQQLATLYHETFSPATIGFFHLPAIASLIVTVTLVRAAVRGGGMHA